jgi:hypothetical protein
MLLGLDDDLYKASPAESSAEATSAYKEQETGCLLILLALLLAPFTLGLSLLLLLLGSTAVFGRIETADVARSRPHARPVHPPAIQTLIEDLKKDCCLRNRAVPIAASSSSAAPTRV